MKHDRQSIKNRIITMAQAGAARPKQLECIEGKFLSNLTCSVHKQYDREFDQLIRSMRPEWFKKSKHDPASLKAELIALAESGVARPSSSRSSSIAERRLANALSHYVNTSCGSYDHGFATKIVAMRPEWFIKSRVKARKVGYLTLATSDGDRPDGYGLKFLTQKAGRHYDPEFNTKIRAIRPDWFHDKTGKLKADILAWAQSGAGRPTQNIGGVRLYRGLRQYVRDEETPDVEFRAKLQALRPEWFGEDGKLINLKRAP